MFHSVPKHFYHLVKTRVAFKIVFLLPFTSETMIFVQTIDERKVRALQVTLFLFMTKHNPH